MRLDIAQTLGVLLIPGSNGRFLHKSFPANTFLPFVFLHITVLSIFLLQISNTLISFYKKKLYKKQYWNLAKKIINTQYWDLPLPSASLFATPFNPFSPEVLYCYFHEQNKLFLTTQLQIVVANDL